MHNMFKRFFIFAAVFILLCNFSTPNFVSAEDKSERSDILGNFEEGEQYFQSLPQKKSYKVKQRPLMIQGAMNAEIENLVRALKNPTVYRFSNYLYIAGTYQNYPVVISRTEQGISNAAAATAIGIEKFNPCAVINQGTAGGHVANIHLNSIVIAEKNINISAYILEDSKDGNLNMATQYMRGTFAYDAASNSFKLFPEYSADSKLLKIAEEVANSHTEFHTIKGTISSADSWIEEVDYIKILHEKYGSLCEEMEGVSAAQICQNLGVPFIDIRVISDNPVTHEKHSIKAAGISQDFVLLVAEKYIDAIKK